MDQSRGTCARRGGDGFAFVVQNYGPRALGLGGGNLGYGGISNAFAVEFDTWFDAELKDPYENHLAILTRGTGELRAEHNNQLGICLDVPDLADGEGHSVRLQYDPLFQTDIATHPSFQAAPHLVDLIYPAAVHFHHGLGTLRVYIDDSSDPALSVPMSFQPSCNSTVARRGLGSPQAPAVATKTTRSHPGHFRNINQSIARQIATEAFRLQIRNERAAIRG